MVLTGRFKVVFGEDAEAVVSPGEMFALEAGTEYGIEALEEGKLISILIGG
jgi:mannose-6-phosphate isomerase-like protein (cupin superfamily)